MIDTHTHFPGHALGTSPRTAADIRREFTAAGLHGAWIMTLDGLISEASRHNDILAEAIRGDLDFFTPFCSVNPHEGEGAATAELIRAKTKLGMRGLKLHPWLQAFSLTHDAVPPILRTAGRLGMPVLFHDGTPPYCTPLQIAAAAEKIPQTTIILGHAGLDDLWRDAILACRRQPNIFLCCCSISSGNMAQVIRECPAEKLLFGSDGGIGPGLVQEAVNKFRAACRDEAMQHQIGFLNPQRLLPRGMANE